MDQVRRRDLAVGVIEHPGTEIRRLLEPARRRGAEADLFKPNCVVWAALRDGRPVAAVTAYVTTDEAVEVVLGGGDLDGLRAIQPLLCRWARDEGARVVRIIGRKGWVRVFGMRIVERDGECIEMELSL